MLTNDQTASNRASRNDIEAVAGRDKPFPSRCHINGVHGVRCHPRATQEVDATTIWREARRGEGCESVFDTIRRRTDDQAARVRAIGVSDPKFRGLRIAQRCGDEPAGGWANECNAPVWTARNPGVWETQPLGVPACGYTDQKCKREAVHLKRRGVVHPSNTESEFWRGVARERSSWSRINGRRHAAWSTPSNAPLIATAPTP